MFSCKVCGCELTNVRLYVQHCRIHSSLPKLRLPCCFSTCFKTSSSVTGLKVHLSREHSKRGLRQLNNSMYRADVKFRCSVPSCIVECVDRTDLVRHLRQHIKEGMTVVCPIKGCCKHYRIQSSFSCHLSRDHTQWSSCDVKCNVGGNETVFSQVMLGIQDVAWNPPSFENEECAEPDDDVPIVESSLNGKDEFIKNLSLFFAKLSTQQLIPDSIVDVIANEFQNINILNQAYLKHDVARALRTAGAPEHMIAVATDALQSGDLVKECLQEGGILHGKVRRATHVKQNFTFVQPQSVHTGLNSRKKNCCCYYIPIKESLLALLKDANVVKQCLSPQQCEDGILRDFTDGSVYRKVTADTSRKYLPLILYQDSFEVVNPLGSAKKKHKVLGVYFVLGNLTRHLRSNTDHMQLVMLINEGDFDRVGQRIFHRLVTDLQVLETEGIKVGNEIHHVVLSAIAGDNLGSHCIGGFVKNFSSAQHICRFCVLTKQEIDAGCMSATVDQIRSPLSYDAAVAKLNSSDDIAIEGIKFNSVFNDLSSFHVCNPGLPPCIAHDLFEGVVAYDLPICLQYFVKKKFLTLNILNRRIESSHLFGADSKVRPALFSKNLEHLSGSASQNWCLLRLIPILLYKLVTPTDDVYQLLLLMRQMVELIVAPAVSLGQVAYMKVVIEDYLERRRTLFPEIKLRPKHHYLSHYASLTLKFGPLIRLWTMRFESKHQYFKRCVRNSHNFINVTRMLAYRHQMYQAYLSAGQRFHDSDVLVESSVDLDLSLCSSKVRELVASLGVGHLQVCKEVTVKGTTYSQGLLLPLNVEHATKEIMFGQIQSILISSSCLYFVVALRHGDFFSEMGCYVIDDETDLQCVPMDCFADHYPLPVYDVQEFSVVALKHQLLDKD